MKTIARKVGAVRRELQAILDAHPPRPNDGCGDIENDYRWNDYVTDALNFLHSAMLSQLPDEVAARRKKDSHK